FDQAAGGFEDGCAGSFGADECAGDVEVVFGKKIVQVVSGDAARDVGELLADFSGVNFSYLFPSSIYLICSLGAESRCVRDRGRDGGASIGIAAGAAIPSWFLLGSWADEGVRSSQNTYSVSA